MNRPDRRPLLARLTLENASTPRTLTAKADGTADSATVLLYDVIDAYWGVSAAEFAKTLAGLDVATLNLRINSPGGDVFEARAMVAAIRGFKGKVVAHIDGLAASAASYLALAASEVRINDGAFLMIHKAWTLAMGNSEDLLATAAVLEKIDASIVADYVAKTGQTEAQVRDWMSAETWFTAAEALDAGFVDAVDSGTVKDAARWNVSAYANAPKALTEPPEPQFDRAALERRLRLLEVC